MRYRDGGRLIEAAHFMGDRNKRNVLFHKARSVMLRQNFLILLWDDFFCFDLLFHDFSVRWFLLLPQILLLREKKSMLNIHANRLKLRRTIEFNYARHFSTACIPTSFSACCRHSIANMLGARIFQDNYLCLQVAKSRWVPEMHGECRHSSHG